jgi:hypothetical protein
MRCPLFATQQSMQFYRFTFLVSGLLACVCLLARADDESVTADDWFQTYYEHPDSGKIESHVEKLQAMGALHKEHAVEPFAALLSRFFKSAKPMQLHDWLTAFGKFPDDDQVAIVTALFWADTKDTRAALGEYRTRGGKLATLAEKLSDSKPPVFEEFTDRSPTELDMCWGAFFATGDKAYVLPIIRCAVKPRQPGVFDITQASAMWSLKSLCQRQKKVQEIKDEFYKSAKPEEQATLDELFKN